MGKVLIYALGGECGAVVFGGFIANPPDALIQPHRLFLGLSKLVQAARGTHSDFDGVRTSAAPTPANK